MEGYLVIESKEEEKGMRTNPHSEDDGMTVYDFNEWTIRVKRNNMRIWRINKGWGVQGLEEGVRVWELNSVKKKNKGYRNEKKKKGLIYKSGKKGRYGNWRS